LRAGAQLRKKLRPEGCGQASAASQYQKQKAAWAAEVETTAEDIDSSEISGNAARKTTEACSLFVRLLELCSRG